MLNRFLVFFLCVLFSFGAAAQILDDFTDGDFTANPAWVGNTTDYTIVSNQLRSNSTIASTSFYLSTPSAAVNNCQWEFWCNLQFNTSGVNYVDVYLIADQSNLSAANLNGYFVRIGNTLDEVCLYKNTAGSPLKIIDGTDNTTNHANNIIKIKVVRDNLNQFTLSDDFTGTGSNYIIEGSVTDNSFLTSNSFGVLIKQSTSSFFQKHFFDDFYVGTIVTDVTPPAISSTTVISSTALDVLFNEDVDLTTGQVVTNYVVNNGVGAAATATRDAVNFKLVHLTFATGFTNALVNTITISGVTDIAGNAIVNGTSNFVYYNVSAPSYKDVIINEIMADPNPAAGTLPLVEWVEIYNASATKTFNVNGWTFSDPSTTSTLNNKYLLPGQYAVLCKNTDTAGFSSFGNVIGMNSMPSLNDAGDNIYLQDNLGNFIDSLNFDISWYHDNTKDGGGWSLELINPGLPAACDPSSNWSASVNANGATPAQQNSIHSTSADVTGPAPLQVSVADSLHLTVCFNELISSSQVAVPANYLVNNGIGNPASVTVDSVSNKCVDILLSTPLQNLTNYTMTFSGMGDCSGNAVSPSSLGFSYYIPAFNDVVIDEFLADPDPQIALPDYEYVELYNRSNYSISMKNWSISTPTTTKTIPEIVIPPDSFVVLTGTSGFVAFATWNINVYSVTGFPALTNGGSTITIRNGNGKIINSVSYDDTWYRDATKKEGGFSLEMIDPGNPCAGENNWIASNDASGGTPGKTNSVYAPNPDLTAPKLKRIGVLSADSIQLFFDEKIDSVTMMSAATYVIDNSIGNPVTVIPAPNDFKSVKLVLPVNLQTGVIYTCVLNTVIKDCAGNVVTSPDNSARFALPQPASPGDIVLNELLYDPKTGGVDFVEVYNNSTKTIDLSKLNIGSQDTVANVLTYTVPVSTEGYLLFPSEYLVISENGSIVKSQYYTPNPNGFLDIATLPAMNTTDDIVVISDNSGVIIDKVVYTDKMQFALLNTTKGVSLERVDFNRPSSDFTNWNSAASTVGFATPAYRNSQYLNADIGNDVTVNPETFSPDNDGYQDVLSITYSLDKPGKSGNIEIFDANGRLVRRLLRAETLSQSGTISWNGLTDANEKAPIGIYVIYFEATDVAGGKVSAFKKSCVLAGKL